MYRWANGTVSLAQGYSWTPQPLTNASEAYANGTIYATSSTGDTVWPNYYRAATVFYCNPFDKFFTTRGDATTREIAESDPEDGWLPLSFSHDDNNVSYVEHAGEQEFLAVRTASWIEGLLPNTYRRHDAQGAEHGGLAGILPIIIALVAFSCRQRDLHDVLITHRAWRGNRWVPHHRQSGREYRDSADSYFVFILTKSKAFPKGGWL